MRGTSRAQGRRIAYSPCSDVEETRCAGCSIPFVDRWTSRRFHAPTERVLHLEPISLTAVATIFAAALTVCVTLEIHKGS